MKIISRAEARTQGLKLYFTGRPCKNGHVDYRRVDDKHCVSCKRVRSRRSYARHSDEIKASQKRYRDANKSARKEYWQGYKPRRRMLARERYQSDPDMKAYVLLRSLLRRSLQATGERKRTRAESLLGYTGPELREHLERQFLSGMGWHNRSEWHIDHITPISWFIENGITCPAKINCLSNLRPVWASDNLRKSRKLETLI